MGAYTAMHDQSTSEVVLAVFIEAMLTDLGEDFSG